MPYREEHLYHSARQGLIDIPWLDENLVSVNPERACHEVAVSEQVGAQVQNRASEGKSLNENLRRSRPVYISSAVEKKI